VLLRTRRTHDKKVPKLEPGQVGDERGASIVGGRDSESSQGQGERAKESDGGDIAHQAAT